MSNEFETEKRKTGLPAAAAETLVLGVIAGLCWPRYFLQAAIIGMIFGRRFLRSGPGTSFAVVWCVSCFLWHTYVEEYSYSFVHAVNPAFFLTGVALAMIAMVARMYGHAWSGLLVLFIAMLPGIRLTNPSNPAPILGFALFLALARFSGAANRIRPLPLGIAALNGFLIIGLLCVYQGNYARPFRTGAEAFQKKNAAWWPPDDPAAPLHALSIKESARRNYGKLFSRVIPYDPTNEAFVPRTIYYMRSRPLQVVTLDMKTWKVRRESFPDAVGSNLVFDISADARFIASTIGSKVVLLDGETLEWLDTLDLGLRSLSDVRFGPTGELFVTSARDGVLYKLQYDRFGHRLRVGRKRKLGVGILGVAYIPQWNLIAASNYFTGDFYLVDPENLATYAYTRTPVPVGMDYVRATGDPRRGRLELLWGTDKTKPVLGVRNYFTLDTSVFRRRPESRHSRYRFNAFFAMPVNFIRSTR